MIEVVPDVQPNQPFLAFDYQGLEFDEHESWVLKYHGVVQFCLQNPSNSE